MSPLVKFEILGVFVNTLTVADKYPVWDIKNLQFHISMQLCEKRKTLSQFFFPLI